MNITIFDLKPWEKELFASGLKKHRVTYFTKPAQEIHLKPLIKTEVLSCFITSKIDKNVLDKLPNLKLIATRSTGFDHIDMIETKKRGIKVMNVPSYGENTVAEHTFALILTLSRKIHQSYIRSKKNDFSIEGLMGFDLCGKTIGVIGCGKIGSHVIRIAKGFEMNVITYDPYKDKKIAQKLGFKYVSLSNLLKQADIISLHVPLCSETKHLINWKNINQIKKGALLINTARGGLVDTDALIKALDTHRLQGAALDVLEEENLIMEDIHLLRHNHKDYTRFKKIIKNHRLLKRDNVIFTPHIAFFSQEAVDRITKTSMKNILGFKP